MTNDFKKKILDWLSGNYTIQSGNNVPQFSEVDNRYNNLQDQLDTLFPNNFYIMGSLQAYSINGDGLKYTIVYGMYYTSSSNEKGFILILDEDFTLIQCITKYSSGTDFGKFLIMNVGDDGNFFAIEYTGTSKRFVMMNNFIAKLPTEENYRVILKKSYALQGETTNVDEYGGFRQLIKAPGQSRYIIGGIEDDGQTIVATELVINVGMSNEWNDYTYNPGDNFFETYDIYANWNSQGNLNFKIVGFYTDTSDDENIITKYASLNGSSSNVGTLTLTTYNYQIATDFLYGGDVKIVNENESYFIITYTTQEDFGIYKYIEMNHFVNGNIQRIYYKKVYDSDVKLYRINNEVFSLIQYSDDESYKLTIGKIIGNNYYEELIRTSEDVMDYMFFVVQKQFDLYNYYVQFENSVDMVNQVYNPNEYNGATFQALNSMIPDRAELISEQVVIFARSLYNKIINNNTTTSIINVPNNYVNDVIIDAQNLYGETKSLLVNNNQDIETNIYEELMINFVNTLLMRNENDINNIIENLAGAIRLNKSISSLLDYDNCKITKYKINYINNTSAVIKFQNINVNYQANKTTYTISFYNENVKNIQLISNDENTIYQTIDISNLEIGKYYLINQDLHID